MSQEPPRLKRRSFVKLCASAVAVIGANPSVLAATDGVLRRYQRAKLVDQSGNTLRVAALGTGENYIFHYPYISTPCFLIDLGKPVTRRTRLKTESGNRYRSVEGVGPQKSVLAFSAICAHKMTHPARSVSFINYRHESVNFKNKFKQTARRSQVIYCCSEKSVYDPAEGARVIGGPAPQPLAAILLEYDSTEDALYATGTYGGEMFEKFFTEFGFRLALEHRTTDVQKPVAKTATTVSLADYCETQILC